MILLIMEKSKRGGVIKEIVICIPNTLLAGGVVMYLEKNSSFKVCREDNPFGVEELCISLKVDVLLVEVRDRSPHTLNEWNLRVKKIKKSLPDAKAVYIVDENSSPELANLVAQTRGDKLIDAFVYGTVSGEYMTALIGSL